MKTTSKYVKQCCCCDTRFSRFGFPKIGAEHKSELNRLMRKAMRRMNLRGTFKLIGNEELVNGFYYEYANRSEELISKSLCNLLYDIACDFYDEQIEECDLVEVLG
jgi:hypothetical protein